MCVCVGMKVEALEKALWGDFYYDAKNRRVLSKPPTPAGGKATAAKPMFVSMVLENVWAVYQALLVEESTQQMNKIMASLQLKLPPRELAGQEWRGKLQAIFRRWLPIPNAVLGMVVKHLPSPIQAQKYRVGRFWPAANTRSRLARAVRQCDRHSSDVLIFVSKMIDIGLLANTLLCVYGVSRCV